MSPRDLYLGCPNKEELSASTTVELRDQCYRNLESLGFDAYKGHDTCKCRETGRICLPYERLAEQEARQAKKKTFRITQSPVDAKAETQQLHIGTSELPTVKERNQRVVPPSRYIQLLTGRVDSTKTIRAWAPQDIHKNARK